LVVYILQIMLKIRLQRVGRKHDPSYRIILTDVRQGPKSGKFIENLGFYDAVRKVKQVKADRIKHWVSNGVQVSDTVHNILVSEKVIEGKKINVLPKKSPVKKEVKEEKKKEEKGDTPSKEIKKEEKVIEEPIEEKVIEEPIEEKTIEESKEEKIILEEDEKKVEAEKSTEEV